MRFQKQPTDREEPPKPTTGLDYTYGRRSKGANIVSITQTYSELYGYIVRTCVF